MAEELLTADPRREAGGHAAGISEGMARMFVILDRTECKDWGYEVEVWVEVSV